MTVYSLLP